MREDLYIFITFNSKRSNCDNSSGGRGAEGGWVEERGVREGVKQGTKIPLKWDGVFLKTSILGGDRGFK